MFKSNLPKSFYFLLAKTDLLVKYQNRKLYFVCLIFINKFSHYSLDNFTKYLLNTGSYKLA